MNTVDTARQNRADVCVAACADLFRSDGEVLASAFGSVPRAAVSLARLTFNPLLLQTDGGARLLAEPPVLGETDLSSIPTEGLLPFRRSFEWVWSGRRHALMGASQLDRFGNANLSSIGPWNQPKAQLIGVRGLPGNTVNHPCSYWIGSHTSRVFVEDVDMVSGVGYDPSRLDKSTTGRDHEIRGIVTNLAVLDFQGPNHEVRLRSVHPGVSVDRVVAATGFDLDTSAVEETRIPSERERQLIREVIDPKSLCMTDIGEV